MKTVPLTPWISIKRVQEPQAFLDGASCCMRSKAEFRIKLGQGDRREFLDQLIGLDHGNGHFMLFEVDSEARAPALPIPISRQTSSAASVQKSAPLPSSRQDG